MWCNDPHILVILESCEQHKWSRTPGQPHVVTASLLDADISWEEECFRVSVLAGQTSKGILLCSWHIQSSAEGGFKRLERWPTFVMVEADNVDNGWKR